MAKGRKTGGRVAGTPNRATADLKTVAREYVNEVENADGINPLWLLREPTRRRSRHGSRRG
jgi:hypothetical protein